MAGGLLLRARQIQSVITSCQSCRKLRIASCRTASTLAKADNCNIIKEVGRVSPTLDVPDSINKPTYAQKGILTNILRKLQGQSQNIKIKNDQEIKGVRDACRLAREVLDHAAGSVGPGVTTDHLDRTVHALCVARGAYPSPLAYKGFPKSVCTSVNNVACHGVPDDRPLQDGDIINVDVTVYYKGFHGDLSETYLVGDVTDADRRLVDVTRHCRDVAISICAPGVPFHYIGHLIQATANEHGYNVIPVFCGHGIGEDFHELPDIFHCANEEAGEMEEGMIFTIEPILTKGDPAISILADGWTAVTKDNSRSAQFEHTVLITREGHEVLTL